MSAPHIVAIVLAVLVVGIIVAEMVRQRRAFREVERALIAEYGIEQIRGLTMREVYVLLRAGALRPLGASGPRAGAPE